MLVSQGCFEGFFFLPLSFASFPYYIGIARFIVPFKTSPMFNVSAYGFSVDGALESRGLLVGVRLTDQ